MKEETLRDIGEFECIHRIAHDLIYRPELVIATLVKKA